MVVTWSPTFAEWVGGTRETREGWHLLIVETPVNGDSKSTNDRFHSLVGLSVPVQEIFVLTGCSSWSSTKFFFPHRTLFKFICPPRQQAGQAVVLLRLYLIVCLWTGQYSLDTEFSER
jgi:hypothetical protein